MYRVAHSRRSLALTVILAVVLAAPALAQRGAPPPGTTTPPAARPARPAQPGAAARPAPGLRDHQHLDTRFSHNRYYYDRGHPVRKPPDGGVSGLRGHDGDRYYFHGGDWYRQRGAWYHWWRGAWVVGAAPIGLLVPLLPPYYTTVWWGGVPYYYANDTYYQWDGDRSEYEVVAPPDDIETAGTTQPPASDRLFAYPRNDQSEEQQAKDQDDCRRWAAAQTGFDPKSSPQLGAKRNEYFRAQVACLEGRGYSVK